MERDFRDEDGFWEFDEQHSDDIDRVIRSMYLQWRKAVEDGTIPSFDVPDMEREEMPEDFRIEVVEKVDGAGLIRSHEEGVAKDLFIYRVNNDGDIDVALLNSNREPLTPDIIDACSKIVKDHYEGVTLSVDEVMRDFYFTFHTK